jgi:hypothetical protein
MRTPSTLHAPTTTEEDDMSQETLHTAARRAVRFFNIDMNKGGLVSHETEHAIQTLDLMVRTHNDVVDPRPAGIEEPDRAATQ